MGRRKQNIEMYGKSWRPMDIPNLKEAVRLMQGLVDLQNNFVDSLSKATDLTAYQQKLYETTTALQETGVKLTQEQAVKLLETFNAQQAHTEEVSKEVEQRKIALTWGNVGSTMSDIFRDRYKNKVYKETTTDLTSGPGSKQFPGLSGADLSSKVEEVAGGKVSAAAGKFNLAGTAMQIAADTFKKGVDTFSTLFKSGLRAQSSAIENNTTKIGAMTGATFSNLTKNQAKLNNELGSWLPYSNNDDLRDNIGSSEVIDMWGKLAESGANQATMYANAVDNIVTNKIVPYLDTTSVLWQQLLSNQPELQKNVRGINATNREIVGNNYATSEILKTVLSDLQPMSELAENNLAMAASGASAAINTLMEMGMSKDDAIAQYKKTYKQRTQGADILTGGSVAEKLEYINLLQRGIDTTNSQNIGRIVYENVATDRALVNSTGSSYNEGNTRALSSNIVTNALFGGDASAVLNLGEGGNLSNDDLTKILTNSTRAQKSYEETANKETQNFVEGLYQTTQDKQEKYMENMTNEVAGILESLGHWGDILDTAIRGIAGAVGAGIVGKGIAAMVGSSGGAAAGAGVGAGLLAGIGTAAAVTAPIAIAAAVGKLSDYFSRKDEQKETDQYILSNPQDKLAQTNGLYASLKGTGKSVANTSGLGKLGTGFAELWNTTLGRIGGGDHDTQNYLSLLNNNLRQSGADSDSTALNYLLFYVAADKANQLSKFGYTTDQLAESLKAYNITDRNQIIDYYNSNPKFFSSFAPKTSSGARITQEMMTSSSQRGWYDRYNLLRVGLDEVPYDNYPAMLHQDEAVLTASTANELRNLIVEYRDANKQAINFEAALQTQTTALSYKLDEVVAAISSLNLSTTTKSDAGFLDNMKYIRSTKSFM